MVAMIDWLCRHCNGRGCCECKNGVVRGSGTDGHPQKEPENGDCKCKSDCRYDCKGECGCEKCHNDYSDFLSFD